MRLLLEGPDKAGKTTLTTNLARVFDLPVIKAVRIGNARRMVRAVEQGLDKMFEKYPHLLLDRWYYPSDLIYEPVVHHQQSALAPLVRVIERRMLALDFLVVYVTADLDELLKRYDREGDPDFPRAHYQEILAGYEEWTWKSNLPILTVNTTNLTPEQTLRHAADMIAQYRVRSLLKNLRRESKA